MTKCFFLVFFYIMVTFVFIQRSAMSQEFSEYESLIKGMEPFKSGKYEKALDEFQKAQCTLPDDPDILFFVGKFS